MHIISGFEYKSCRYSSSESQPAGMYPIICQGWIRLPLKFQTSGEKREMPGNDHVIKPPNQTCDSGFRAGRQRVPLFQSLVSPSRALNPQPTTRPLNGLKHSTVYLYTLNYNQLVHLRSWNTLWAQKACSTKHQKSHSTVEGVSTWIPASNSHQQVHIIKIFFFFLFL